MINDSLLADRLNAFRNGDELPEVETKDVINTNQMDIIDKKVHLVTKISAEVLNLILIFIKSLAYGFAINTIFSQDWKFIAILAVGFSLDTIISTITGLFIRNT